MAFRLSCFSLIFLLVSYSIRAQVLGCTDPQATNYNILATQNNGSCLYNNTSYNPSSTITLSDSLEELSGMAYWKGCFWGHNDGGHSPWLFAMDTLTGMITKVIKLTGATNVDWEDMTQDENHFYIGDFGNNTNGNRKDLVIYKIPKSEIEADEDTILLEKEQYETILFAYPDQTDFAPTGGNKTRFDCEALFFHRQKLHLITKNWIGDYAVHYTLPTDSGIHVAIRQDSLFTGGFMITGADIGAEDQILLTAYNRSGMCSFYLIYGYNDPQLFFKTGNKRRIQLPLSIQIGQLESICFINGIRGATGSEKFAFQNFNVPQNVRRFTTFQWVIDHYKRNSVTGAEEGMMRYNTDMNGFEYFDGKTWVKLGTD